MSSDVDGRDPSAQAAQFDPVVMAAEGPVMTGKQLAALL